MAQEKNDKNAVSLKSFMESQEAKKKTKKPVMIYINEDSYRQVLGIVRANGVSFNFFVDNLCRLFLEDKIQMKPEDLQTFFK